MLILLLLNCILLFGIWRRLKPRKQREMIVIEYYDGPTPEEFDQQQFDKFWESYPELRYEILRDQLEMGEIDKATYDNAIENLIKDITI